MKTVVSFLLMSGVVLSYILMTNETDIELSTRSPASIPADYDSLKGCQKQEILWKKSQDTVYKDLPDFRKFGALQLISMGMQELTTKAELHSDFAPDGWKKYLHRRGSLAKVKIVPVAQKFTGIFEGAECALLRLSLTYRAGGSKPVAPGLALKVLRDHSPSGNLSALVSLEGQGLEYNIFKYPMSNIVPASTAFGQKLVHKVFSKYSKYPEELLASDLAAVDAKGVVSKSVKAPRHLFFVPSPTLSFSSEEHDIRDDLKSIPEGTTLYEIRSVTEKHLNDDYSSYTPEKVEVLLADSEHIADVVTTSEFVSSEFGDDGIFFRHQIRPKK